MCDLIGCEYKANDESRHDAQDALCLSIEWPNYKVFYSFRMKQENIDANRKWAVLSLPAKILWEKRCCFNTTNAADSSMSSQTFEQRQGIRPFLKMFEDYNLQPRKELGIPPYFTTNPQAEVLCLDAIDKRWIERVYLDDAEAHKKFKDKFPAFDIRYNSSFHRYRSDWKFWK